MDIFNRPPTIADDTVIYRIYPPQDVSSDKTAVSSISALMLSYVQDSLLPSNHIWHRDAFTLKVVEEDERSGKSAKQWVIEGTMRVGDCVDDEWCVVWLLTEISKKWDVVISVYDSDGEFLLIEAAEHLPNWVTPTNSENRIWIHRSQLHIIPLEHISPKGRPQGSRRRALPNQEEEDEIQESEESYISIQDALRIVRDSTIPTVASPAVQEAAFARIKGYPGVLSQHVHTTKVYLPSDVVLALSQNPYLVQKAVEAFYTRDALQLRAAARMTRFPPSTSILAPVTLTRTAYAQLSGQKFHPPRIFGVWQEQEGTKDWRYKDIGMKIACGFEMVYSESKSNAGVTGVSTTSQESVEALKDALRRDPSYTAYIQSLKQASFFPEGELEGSSAWKDRESKAALHWIELKKEDTASRPSFTSLVDQAIAASLPNKDAILSRDPSNLPEDSDTWLNVSPDDLEQKLAQTFGSQKKAEMDVEETQVQTEDAVANARAEKLEKLAKKVETFVETEGDLEGARFDDDLLSDEEIKFSDSEESDDEILDAELRQKAMDTLVPPLDPSEYGKISAASDNPYDKEEVNPRQSKSQKITPVTLETERRTMPNGETRRIRKPILMRDKFDGVDSDDESSEEEDDTTKAVNSTREEDESDDERPQVVGGVNIDMDINMEDEEEDFLKFTREALGISDTMWYDIVKERKERGAFVPTPKAAKAPPEEEPQTTSKDNTDRFFDEIPIPTPRAPREKRPIPPEAVRNPNLNSFETVMQALDEELEKSRQARKASKTGANADTTRTTSNGKGKGKEKAQVEEASDEEGVDEAMDAELRQALRRDEDNDDDDDDENEVAEAGMDYNLIKNFLESFRNQQGTAGPVSNLAGRLMPGFNFPRDES